MPKVPFSLWTSFSTFGLIELIVLHLYSLFLTENFFRIIQYSCKSINSINPNIENGVVYA